MEIKSLTSLCLNVMTNCRYLATEDTAEYSDLEDAEKCEEYCKHRVCISQGRHLSREKKKLPKTSAEICMHRVNYKKTMFPRYKYHLELIEKHKREYDICIPPQSIILVYGKEADVSRNLLHPMELHQTTLNDQNWEDVILVVFNNSTNGDWKTLDLDKDKMIKCRWFVIVSSDTKSKELQDDLAASNITNFSVVLPNADELWNHLTSAMELPLIENLREKKRTLKSSDSVFEDVGTILRRIEKCSDFPEIKNENKSHDIPQSIKDNLKRFEGEIVRYGFHFDNFRVVVKYEKYEDVKKALMATRSDKFCKIDVIRQDDFKETVVPFNGNLRAQGMKLLQSPAAQQEESSQTSGNGYGTLGSLALLNNEQTIALSCGHVCVMDKIVYIENERKEPIALGKCLYTSGEVLKIQSDLAIVGVNSEVEKYFPEKKLLNHMGEPMTADVLCVKDKLDIRGEIVHKLGATTKWTQGKIVSSEIVDNVQGVITVKGMNGKLFGKAGDSGSIVFRESPNARERKLEVVAVLSAGKFEYKDQMAGEEEQESAQKLVLCSVFKDALEQIREKNDSIESVEFFNDKATE